MPQRSALQRFDHADSDRATLEYYPRMMDALVDDAARLPTDRNVELGFETLEQTPIAALRHIYDTLGLTGFSEDEPRFTRYLEANTGYRKNAYRFPPEDNRLVERYWQPYIDRCGYTAPE